MKKYDNLPDFSKLYKTREFTISDIVSLFIFLFFSAAFGGYIWEVLIFLVKERAFVNRGFLYGPWLPVYGIGAVLFSLVLSDKMLFFPIKKMQKKHPIKVFILSALLGSGLELFIGWFLDAIWQLRYWNYSDYFLNFHGYICLVSAVCFGIAGVLWICVICPALTKFWFHFSSGFRKKWNTIIVLLFLIDCAAALIFPNIGRNITF